MTRGLDSLIRLHRWRLAEKRQAVDELERLAARLRNELNEIDRQAAAGSDPATGSSFDEAGGDAPTPARRATLALSLMEVENRMHGALRAVANAAREIRKYDLVKARRDRAAKEREGQRSEVVIDRRESPHPRRSESL